MGGDLIPRHCTGVATCRELFSVGWAHPRPAPLLQGLEDRGRRLLHRSVDPADASNPVSCKAAVHHIGLDDPLSNAAVGIVPNPQDAGARVDARHVRTSPAGAPVEVVATGITGPQFPTIPLLQGSRRGHANRRSQGMRSATAVGTWLPSSFSGAGAPKWANREIGLGVGPSQAVQPH